MKYLLRWDYKFMVLNLILYEVFFELNSFLEQKKGCKCIPFILARFTTYGVALVAVVTTLTPVSTSA